MFVELIHKNEQLTKPQKFYYLQAYVSKGSARQYIELPLTEANYDLAWSQLLNHYDNETRIIKRHIQNLYDLKNVQENSASSLQVFLKTILQNYHSLRILGQPVDQWDTLLVHHLSSKLDYASRREVEKTAADRLLKFDDFVKTLEDRARLLDTLGSVGKSKNANSQKSKVVMSVVKLNCKICTQEHAIFKCDKFKEMTVEQRYNTIKQLGICINCLSNKHKVPDCKAGVCRTCHRKHHTLLHNDRLSSKPNNGGSTDVDKNANVLSNNSSNTEHPVAAMICGRREPKQCQVLLATAIIYIIDSTGQRHLCRALLDNGSQCSFMTENTKQRLRLPQQRVLVPVTGINQSETYVKFQVHATLQSCNSNYQKRNVRFLIVPRITGELPSQPINVDNFKLPDNMQLADPHFYKPHRIDILLGADVFWDLIIGNKIKLNDSMTPLINTVFGYIVTGKTDSDGNSPMISNTISLCTLVELSDQIKRFWLQEEITTTKLTLPEEKLCEQHYADHVTRAQDGRYTVTLPIKQGFKHLGASRESALKQLLYLERRLSQNPDLKVQYRDFLDEYQALGHMEEVTQPELALLDGSSCYYLPHHFVLKPTSLTTKLRVVFNASAKTSNGNSLNDMLMVGPVVQQDLFSILLRFRRYFIALTADITKMYRQINIDKNQMDLQHILWRKDSLQPIQCFRLTTITYGTASAPFLATRTLKQLALDECNTFPQASKAMLTDFYVDDFIGGATSYQEANELKQQLIERCSKGGFELRNWSSNHASLATIPSNNPSLITEPIRTLGMLWDTNKDRLSVSVSNLKIKPTLTKRNILSEITQLYDPLGLYAPVIFWAKSFLQELWKHADIQWDNLVPHGLQTKWTTFRDQLSCLTNMHFSRSIFFDQSSAYNVNPTDIKHMELHGFGDASELGYGCCVYICITDHNLQRHVNLIAAKSRVAPLRKLTIPRLELCAALLLAELVSKILSILELNCHKIFLWSDSTITLWRIKSSSTKYTTFVANRIAQIQELTSVENWRYIPSELNPADIVSRGLEPKQFLDAKLWYHGPSFLKQSEHLWPEFNLTKPSQEGLELRKAQTILTSTEAHIDDIINRYSDFNKLVRITAMCHRFIKNCKSKASERIITPLSSDDMDHALQSLLRHVQKLEFESEIKLLTNDKPLNSNNRLISLCPFIDNNQLMRVGGRLDNAEIPFNQKHPVILYAKNNLSVLIARYFHNKNLHAGALALLNIIRQDYWIISGRNLCKKIVHQCIRCFRTKPTIAQQIMGALPTDRVTYSKPFLKVGIDFCGPFYCRQRIRSRTTIKTYVALFICFVTKAVHLEVVFDLTTEAFLAALRRFIARRGHCQVIVSDNATNFKGAQSALHELHQLFQHQNHENALFKFCAEERIKWNTIPPRSPHFGGLWEAAVKASKHHMKRTIGTTTFSTEELITIVTQIEGCLNSRPLTPLSSDSSDLTALTPGHFLIGRPITSLVEPNLGHLQVNRLTRWQQMQQTFQQFWRRWSTEYLNELQQRCKWKQPTENLTPNTLVLIKEDNVPPLCWPLGRIVDCFPSSDGRVRVVSIKTQQGTFKRAISRICILPIERD